MENLESFVIMEGGGGVSIVIKPFLIKKKQVAFGLRTLLSESINERFCTWKVEKPLCTTSTP